MLFKTIYTAAAIFQFQYNLMRTVRWLRSGAAANIKFPGTEFRRGPLQLHSIQECRAWTTATWSWRQNAHIPFWTLSTHHVTEELYEQHKKSRKVYLSWRAVSTSPKSAPQSSKLPLNPNCTLLQTISVNPRTVSCSERERDWGRRRKRERRKGEWLEKERGACAQLQQGFMAWETIYKSQRLS